MLRRSKILICRPQEQADKLAIAIQSQGWQPIVFPTVAIQPIDALQPMVHLPEAWVQQASLILIQSPSSVRYINQPSLALLQQSSVIYAMGAGTQEALLSYGIGCRWLANRGAASEDILHNSPVTDLLKGSQILLLTGEGGRSVLESALIKKGFICHRVNTYQRAVPVYTEQACEAVMAQQPVMAVITSVDILKNLLSIFKYYPLIHTLSLLVISPRIQQAAISLGWQGKIYVADSASTEDIIAAIERLAI